MMMCARSCWLIAMVPGSQSRQTLRFKCELTTISFKLGGRPVSGSTINLVPSGAFLSKLRTSRCTLALVLCGKTVSFRLLDVDIFSV